jgi:hypothetical protein
MSRRLYLGFCIFSRAYAFEAKVRNRLGQTVIFPGAVCRTKPRRRITMTYSNNGGHADSNRNIRRRHSRCIRRRHSRCRNIRRRHSRRRSRYREHVNISAWYLLGTHLNASLSEKRKLNPTPLVPESAIRSRGRVELVVWVSL